MQVSNSIATLDSMLTQANINNPNNSANMSDKRAGQLLTTYFDKLDTGAGIGGKDGKVSDKDLKAIANDPNQPIELRQAANKLLTDKPLRNQVNQGGQHGDSFSKDELLKLAGSDQTLGHDGREPLGATAAPAHMSAFDRVQTSPRPQPQTAANNAPQGNQSAGQSSAGDTNSMILQLLMMLLPMLMKK